MDTFERELQEQLDRAATRRIVNERAAIWTSGYLRLRRFNDQGACVW